MEHHYTFWNKILLAIGAGTATANFTLQNINEVLAIILKFISLASFACYILINQDAIESGWIKMKNRFK